jgi:hemerythrin-like domain-containing protein
MRGKNIRERRTLMTPSEQLKEEHQGILLMLDILGKACEKLEKREKIDITHLEQMVEFFKVFADRCHHGKEEDLLFPELEKAGIPKEHGPIGVMLAEHVQGRGFIRGMNEALADMKKGDSKAQKEWIQNARNYKSLLTQHIQKENNVLFPMGDRALSQKTQDHLVDQFEVLEREKIGEGTHEKLHELLNQFKKIYL